MRVLELWRYPVKSLQGERLDTADIGPEGIVGDRGWALFDLDTGFGLTARRVPDLLFASGRLRGDGSAEIVLPDGTATTDDAALSAWLGRRVSLRQAGAAATAARFGQVAIWSPCAEGSPQKTTVPPGRRTRRNSLAARSRSGM